jgi:hypothetical protein
MSKHSHDFLISTNFDFGGRDIQVVVEHDGISYWTDVTGARQDVRKNSRKSAFEAFCDGDTKATDYISHLHGEHTFFAPIPEADLKLIRDELSERYWAECDQDFSLSKKLEAILLPIFWEHVNPHLSSPCTRS